MIFKSALCCVALQVLLHATISNCQNYTEGEIRLAGGPTYYEGRVEVYTRGQWGTMCDDGAGDSSGSGLEEAQVVCRQLGLLDGTPLYASDNEIPDGDGLIALDNVRCVGNETSLFQCAYSTTHNCYHSEDFGVRCNASLATTPSSGSTTTTVPPNLDLAFSVARTSTQVSNSRNVVQFTYALINDGGHFDMTTSTFVIPYKDLYWVSMSVGVDNSSQADAYLTGSGTVSNIMRGLGGVGYDTISREEIFDLTVACGQVNVLSNYRTYSDSFLQTSLSGFKLDPVMDTQAISFAFSRSQSYVCSITSRIPFDLIQMDEGAGWRSADSAYYAPRSGVYVINLSVGAEPGNPVSVGLYNYGSLIAGVQQGSTNHGYESLSKTIVTQLTAGDQIFAACNLYATSYVYSQVKTQTKLSGFLYSPHDFSPVAWSVGNNQAFTGLNDNVPFPIIMSNVGGAWVNQTLFVTPVSGVYYFNMATAVNTGFMTRMDLVINGTGIANVFRSATDHNGVRTRSRSLVYRLQANQIARIRVPAGYQMYSTDSRLSTFSGFLVYPSI